MAFGVAVDFAGAGQEEAGVFRLGQAERVVRAERADLERLDREVEVIDRAGRRREVQNVVHRAGDLQRLRHVVPEECEPVVGSQVLDIGRRAGDEVIDADDLVAARQKALAQVGADETRAAGDDRSHCVVPFPSPSEPEA